MQRHLCFLKTWKGLWHEYEISKTYISWTKNPSDCIHQTLRTVGKESNFEQIAWLCWYRGDTHWISAYHSLTIIGTHSEMRILCNSLVLRFQSASVLVYSETVPGDGRDYACVIAHSMRKAWSRWHHWQWANWQPGPRLEAPCQIFNLEISRVHHGKYVARGETSLLPRFPLPLWKNNELFPGIGNFYVILSAKSSSWCSCCPVGR